MANQKLDSGFLIRYEWLPMLEGLGYREFKNVLMTLIHMQRDCAEIGAVSAQYRRSIGALSTQKARTTAAIIGAVIERRVIGKVSKINGKMATEEKPTTSPTNTPTTSPTPSPKKRGDNIEEKEYKYSSSSWRAPTREEVAAYAAKKKGKTDPEIFFNHFEARGWMMPDGAPVRDWRKMFDIWDANYDEDAEERRKKKAKGEASSFNVEEMFASALARSYASVKGSTDKKD